MVSAQQSQSQLGLPDATKPALVASLPLATAIASASPCELSRKIHAASCGEGCKRQALGKHAFPVSEDMLERITSSQRRQGISNAMAISQFDREMERLATGERRFPSEGSV